MRNRPGSRARLGSKSEGRALTRSLAIGPLALLPIALLLGAASASSASASSASASSGGVTVTVNGLRNTKGMLRACITADAREFPDCTRASRTVSIAAANGAVLSFPNLPAGRYAISILHDENGDGRMNKMLMLPKEGFGFSRDAPVRMGPPSFASAAMDIGQASIHTTIRIRYF